MFHRATKAETVAGARSILVGAEELLARGRNWTSYTFARDENGKRVSPLSPCAAKYCVVGAMTKSRHDGKFNHHAWVLAVRTLRHSVGSMTLMGANDGFGGYGRIQDGLRAAILELDKFSELEAEAMYIGRPVREIEVLPLPAESPSEAPTAPPEPAVPIPVPHEPLVPV